MKKVLLFLPIAIALSGCKSTPTLNQSTFENKNITSFQQYFESVKSKHSAVQNDNLKFSTTSQGELAAKALRNGLYESCQGSSYSILLGVYAGKEKFGHKQPEKSISSNDIDGLVANLSVAISNEPSVSAYSQAELDSYMTTLLHNKQSFKAYNGDAKEYNKWNRVGLHNTEQIEEVFFCFQNGKLTELASTSFRTMGNTPLIGVKVINGNTIRAKLRQLLGGLSPADVNHTPSDFITEFDGIKFGTPSDVLTHQVKTGQFDKAKKLSSQILPTTNAEHIFEWQKTFYTVAVLNGILNEADVQKYKYIVEDELISFGRNIVKSATLINFYGKHVRDGKPFIATNYYSGEAMDLTWDLKHVYPRKVEYATSSYELFFDLANLTCLTASNAADTIAYCGSLSATTHPDFVNKASLAKIKFDQFESESTDPYHLASLAFFKGNVTGLKSYQVSTSLNLNDPKLSEAITLSISDSIDFNAIRRGSYTYDFNGFRHHPKNYEPIHIAVLRGDSKLLEVMIVGNSPSASFKGASIPLIAEIINSNFFPEKVIKTLLDNGYIPTSADIEALESDLADAKRMRSEDKIERIPVKTEQLALARKVFNEAPELPIAKISSLLEEGTELFEKQSYVEAAEIFSILANANVAKGYLYLGLIDNNKEDFEAAMSRFEKSFELGEPAAGVQLFINYMTGMVPLNSRRTGYNEAIKVANKLPHDSFERKLVNDYLRKRASCVPARNEGRVNTRANFLQLPTAYMNFFISCSSPDEVSRALHLAGYKLDNSETYGTYYIPAKPFDKVRPTRISVGFIDQKVDGADNLIKSQQEFFTRVSYSMSLYYSNDENRAGYKEALESLTWKFGKGVFKGDELKRLNWVDKYEWPRDDKVAISLYYNEESKNTEVAFSQILTFSL